MFKAIESDRSSVLGEDSCLIMVAQNVKEQDFHFEGISFKTKEMQDCRGNRTDNAPGITLVCKKRIGEDFQILFLLLPFLHVNKLILF